MTGGSAKIAETSGFPVSRRLQILRTAIVAVAAAVVLVYAAHAAALALYPWDWSPDEGLTFDYARRLLHDPASLYRRSVVPIPLVYTPLLTVVMAPIVALWDPPFAPARVLAFLWTAVAVWAVYALVRPRASRTLAIAAAAALLAPLDVSFWYMLLRVDGLMIALWLCAAVLLLPRSLTRGADRLGGGRMGWGAALLLAAVLTKPTAVFHGAPLVLAWLWVDLRSGLRLAGVMTVAGLAAAGGLQLLSAGGFLWVNQLWGYHIQHEGLMSWLLVTFSKLVLPILVWVLAGFALAAWCGARPWQDPAVVLVLGGLAMVPGMNKFGAWWNYVLPGLAALLVAGGRWWGAAEGRWAGGAGEAAVLLAAGALGVMAVTRTFPTPTAQDEKTAETYHAFLKQRVTEAGRPLLANRPDYTYFHVGQPVEIDGSHFILHANLRLPGTEGVLRRLEGRQYAVVSEDPHLWPRGPFRTALDRQYRRVGLCGIGFYYGIHEYILHVPRDSPARFSPPPGTRCVVLEPSPSP